MTRYACPSCQARSRFNMIKQTAIPIKIDTQSGELITLENLEAYHLPYQGPEYRIQCASCGLVEDEIRFIKMAENNNRFS